MWVMSVTGKQEERSEWETGEEGERSELVTLGKGEESEWMIGEQSGGNEQVTE